MRLLFLLILASCTHGSVRLENDWGAHGIKNNDKYFTHGSKFSSYVDTDRNSRQTYSIGQNIYTPSEKRADASPVSLSTNRPYTGWLYGEYRDATIKDSTKTVYGMQLGCSGRCSYAKETQQGIHKLLDQSIPTWDRNYSLKSEPGLILELEKYYGMATTANFDSTYFVRGKLGNIITSASIGSSFRIGENLQDFDPEPITFKGPKTESDWSYYTFCDIEGRYVPYNHFLDGSLFQDERHTVDSVPIVGQIDLGFRAGYKNLKFSYSYIMITDEWSQQGGPFFFSGLDFSW